MTGTLITLFYIIALLCFAGATGAGDPTPPYFWRHRLIPAGLFFWLLAILISTGGK